MNQVETLLQQRNGLQGDFDGRKIIEKQKVQTKIDGEMQVVKQQLDQLNTVFKTQLKKKEKYPDIENKRNILNSLNAAYDILKAQNDGNEEPTQDQGKKGHASIDELLASGGDYKAPPAREITKEEQDKIDEWGNKIKVQDQQIRDVILKDIKQLGKEAKTIGQKEDELSKKIEVTSKMADKTDKKLDEQAKKLHAVLEKYKSADKFCIDIILFLVCIGLVAVLYNVIKSKYFSSSSTPKTTNNTTNKTFLYYY